MPAFLLPLLPLLIAALIIGGKIGLLTSRSFFALAKDLEEQAHPLDAAAAADILKKWHKNPASIVSEADVDEVRAIKLAHVAKFTSQVKPWKTVARIATIGGAIAAVVLYSYR